MMRALHLLITLLTLGAVRIPWIKRIMRRSASRMVELLLQLRSRDYVLPEQAVALVIAPHQDDGTLGCGGLMLRKRLNKQPVHIAYVTDGSASHPGHPSMPPQALAAVRESEARAASRCIGIEPSAVHFLGARDGTLEHLSSEARAAIIEDFRRLLIAIQPDEVFIPYRRDGSSEHEAVFRLFTETLAGIDTQPRIYEYLVWSWWNPLRLVGPLFTARRTWRFRFRGNEATKIAALQCYRSQFEPTPPWPEPVLDHDFVRLFHRPCEFYFEI